MDTIVTNFACTLSGFPNVITEDGVAVMHAISDAKANDLFNARAAEDKHAAASNGDASAVIVCILPPA